MDARDRLLKLVRSIPDFPRPGILFRDITPVLSSPDGLSLAVRAMIEPWKAERITHVVCVESRGFIFGAAIACEIGVGMIPVRKPGKLPSRTRRKEYALEYGTDALEIHEDALRPGDRALIVDDLLATGGTAAAAAELARGLGAEILGASFLIELTALRGRGRLSSVPRVESVLQY